MYLKQLYHHNKWLFAAIVIFAYVILDYEVNTIEIAMATFAAYILVLVVSKICNAG